MQSDKAVRIGIDIGGTFTDIVAASGATIVGYEKLPSTPQDYSRAIETGVARLMARCGIRPDEIAAVVHATTVATNAILEGRGARTGLLTTAGFRDVLELQRIRIPELYNFNYEKPKPLVPRALRLEVRERLAHDGSVLRPLDLEGLETALERFRTEGIEALAISFLHAYANPVHEEVAAAAARRVLGPDVFLSVSSSVLPEIREYERTSTTVINAYVGPTVSSYVRRIRGVLDALGIGAPLRIMQSNGGVLNAEAVVGLPAAIVESGPAAGVIGGALIARDVSGGSAITIDMGGTTAKASLIENGQVTRTTEYEVGAGINISSMLVKGRGHALRLPVIDISEIGAGGGSIARVDAAGRLHVGPHSAGAEPGPVAYGRGGERATLTDAMVALGYLNDRAIAGGAVAIDRPAAEAAIREQVAGSVGGDVRQAAHGVYLLSASIMTRAVKAVTTLRGRDPRHFGLIAFGGNGALMAAQIADNMGIRRVVVPPMPGVFSATGLTTAAVQREIVQSHFCRLDERSAPGIAALVQTLSARARTLLLDDGCSADGIHIAVQADLRYAGQAYELTVPLTGAGTPAELCAQLSENFHAEHEHSYGHCSRSEPIDLVNLRIVAHDDDGLADLPQPSGGGSGESQPARSRDAYFGRGTGDLRTPILRRADLGSGPRPGPLIVEEYDATILIPPGWSAHLDGRGNVVLER
ncbi:MAG: hydantoinase/oxoprolinase family protein [Rhizobiaceae bacterium]|nr:hydantoinase/oxoprolinase family protein [Rhizobiaceae bacterium]